MKRIIFMILFFFTFLMLNSQMMDSLQKNFRLHAGLVLSNVYGDDVDARKEEGIKIQEVYVFGAGISYIGLSNINLPLYEIWRLEPGVRYITRGFVEKFDDEDGNKQKKNTYISCFDILGRLHFGLEGPLTLFVGSGVAIAPFTEYYNTFNVPIVFGLEFRLAPNWTFIVEGDVIVTDFPSKGVYPDFEKVNSMSWLFGAGFLF